MHNVLYIDEILENIFSLQDSTSALARAATCCKAWQDPALDKLWVRLSSIEPLLALIKISAESSQKLRVNDEAEFAVFRSYARRVKFIPMSAQTQIVKTSDAARFLDRLSYHSPAGILPNLRNIQLTLNPARLVQNNALFPLSRSTKMSQVDLNLGFAGMTRREASLPMLRADETETSIQLCFLLSFLGKTPNSFFTELNVRGLITPAINNKIAALTNLTILSLQTGPSLSVNTLVAVSNFPRLTNLEIQLSHFMAEHEGIIVLPENAFPALQALRIRGRSAIIQRVLESLTSNTLNTLQMDIEDDVRASVPWHSLFTVVKRMAETSLIELTVERHIDIEDLMSSIIDLDVDVHDANDNTSNTNFHPDYRKPNPLAITFSSLLPLLELSQMQRCIFDTTIPPDLGDADVVNIIRAWKHIEHLHLGDIPDVVLDAPEFTDGSEADTTATPAEEDETDRPILTRTSSSATLVDIPHPIRKTGWYPRMTVNSLVVLASSAPNLTSLILPLDLSAGGFYRNTPSRSLTFLSKNKRFPGNSRPSPLHTLTICSIHPRPYAMSAQFLLGIFPALVNIDGSPEFAADWAILRRALVSA